MQTWPATITCQMYRQLAILAEGETMTAPPATLKDLRDEYHQQLKTNTWRYVEVKNEKTGRPKEVPSNADGSSGSSVAIARGMLSQVASLGAAPAGQTKGKNF